MGLLDYLFGDRVDPEAAHNVALKGLLAEAVNTPQPKPEAWSPGTPGRDAWDWMGSNVFDPMANGVRSVTGNPLVRATARSMVGSPISNQMSVAGNAPTATETAYSLGPVAPQPVTPNEYYPQTGSAPVSAPWVARTEDTPLAKTITAIENNPPAAPAVAPDASQATASAVPQGAGSVPAAQTGSPPASPAAGASFREPDFMDRLSTFGRNLEGHGLLGALGDAMGARSPQELEAMNATYQGLLARKVPEDMARAAVLNPQFGAQVYAKMFPEFTQIGTNIMSQPTMGWANPVNQTVTGLNGQPAGTLHGPGGTQDIVNLLKDPGFAADVKAFAEGREIPSGRPGPYQQAVRTAAQLKYGTDESMYQARANARKTMMPGGKWADMKVAANAAIGHLNDLNDQAADLHNVSNMGVLNGAINSAWNKIAEQRGETPRDKALVRFQQTKQLANKELNEFYIKGGGTEAERAALEKEINAAGSEPQLHAAIANAVHLMASKSKPMENDLNAVFSGTGETFNMVEPQNQAKVDRILKSAGQPSMFGTQASAGPLKVASFEDALKLPSGTVFVTPDGRKKVRP